MISYRLIPLILALSTLLSACKENAPKYNGYIDADLTYLSSDFPGRLRKLAVIRGQSVEKKQFLFTLDQNSEHFGIQKSQWNERALESQKNELLDQIHYDEINYRRTLRMRKRNAASQNDLDVAKKDLDALKNQLLALEAQIKSSHVDTEDKRWQTRQKENHAPDAGIIFDTYFTQDEYVQAGQPVVSLITPSNIKVVFFVPETQLSRLPLNANIRISSDGNATMATGVINYISKIAQYTPPVIYSREDRQNLVFRIEARLDNPNLNQIHLGQPISVERIS